MRANEFFMIPLCVQLCHVPTMCLVTFQSLSSFIGEAGFAHSSKFGLPLIISKTQMPIIVDQDSFARYLLDLSIFAWEFVSSQTDDIIELWKVNVILGLGPVDGILKLHCFFSYRAVNKRVNIGLFHTQIVKQGVMVSIWWKEVIVFVFDCHGEGSNRPAVRFVAKGLPFHRFPWVESGVLVVIKTLQAVLIGQVEVFLLQIWQALVEVRFLFLQLEYYFVELAIPALQILYDRQHLLFFRVELGFNDCHFLFQVLYDRPALVVVEPELSGLLL